MNATLKKAGVAALAAMSIAGATLATSSTAEARWHGRWHHHGGWVGPAVVGGLALGALAASRPYYYDGGCYFRRRVVGYTSWGRPIVRPVRVCY